MRVPKSGAGGGSKKPEGKPQYSARKQADVKKMGELMQAKVQKPIKRNPRSQ